MSVTRRVGLVGIENSHAEDIVRYLNAQPHELSAARVSAIVAGEPDRTAKLTQLGAIETVVQKSQDLLSSVDALIVTSRDGAEHAAQALPFLEAGIPVWVDKPLAASLADAESIVAAAEQSGAALTSSSALRWVPDTTAIVAAMAAIGPLQEIVVSGPADPNSEYGGIFFYGIHAADIAQRLLPGRPDDIEVTALPAGISVRYSLGTVRVTLELLGPDSERRIPFWASASGQQGAVEREILLPDNYVQPGVNAFVGMLRSGIAPIPYRELVAPIAILESVQRVIESTANS
jgi:predicted dehydrogenase